MKVLAGDIGGTKSLLAIVDVEPTACRVVFERRYVSREFDGPGLMIEQFLAAAGSREQDRACLGVPGTVVGDDCRAVNLPWKINAVDIAHETGCARTLLINDFTAVAYGLEALTPADLATLQPGRCQARAPKAVLGAGTGLGEALLIWDGQRYVAVATEGGHADLAPTDDLQTELLTWLRRIYGHVSVERVLSGAGLVLLWQFLVETGKQKGNPDVRLEMDREDPAAVVSRHGLAGDDAACVHAVDLFAALYGAEAGNLALRALAHGGVYIAGGIAPRMLEKLRAPGFLKAFREKGRMTPLLESVPLHVIVNDRVGLLGAAVEAARMK